MNSKVYCEGDYLFLPGAVVWMTGITAIFPGRESVIIDRTRGDKSLSLMSNFCFDRIVLDDKDGSILEQAVSCFAEWKYKTTEAMDRLFKEGENERV